MNDLDGYFDYAAATPMHPKVVAAMQPYFSKSFYNPSAIYSAALYVKKDVDEARATVARQLGCRPTEVIFTAGGTEANNLAISGVLKKYPNSKIVTSAIEHESVLNVAKKYNNTVATVTKKGLVNVDSLKQSITDDTVLVSIMLVNNEIGSIQPIKAIAQLVSDIKQDRLKRGVKAPLYLHTDACQATNYLDIHVARLGVDFMTINTGKIYGPKQSGVLYVKAGIVLEPLIFGGGQEFKIRSGTENVASIIGFAKAMQIARKSPKTEAVRLLELRNEMAQQLKQAIPNLEINGPGGAKQMANNLHITIPGIDNERFLMELDERGFQVATGSACSASSDEPSHVLTAIGKPNKDIFSSLRITLGKYTTEDSCTRLTKNIIDLA